MSTIKKSSAATEKPLVPTHKTQHVSTITVTMKPLDTEKSLSKPGVGPLTTSSPVGKQSPDSTVQDSQKSVWSHSSALKVSKPLGSVRKSSATSQSGSASLSTSDLKLVGLKLTNEQAASAGNNAAITTSNGWTPLGSELPPCKICGEKASGLHYGVNSCEACKAFFRRTLKKTTVDFNCTCTEKERKFGVDRPRKTSCPKCRYERCVNVGMSKDAIKIGRYTINRKRQNDREVKSLKVEGSNVLERRTSQGSEKSNSSSSPYSTGHAVSSPEELSTDITSLKLEESNSLQMPKKKRWNDGHDPEAGFLYKSLTNSIFQSLLENQISMATLPFSKQNNVQDISTVEKLFMEPFDPTFAPLPGYKSEQNSAANANLNTELNGIIPNKNDHNPFAVTSKQNDLLEMHMEFNPDVTDLLQERSSFSPNLLSEKASMKKDLQKEENSAIESLFLAPTNLGVHDHQSFSHAGTDLNAFGDMADLLSPSPETNIVHDDLDAMLNGNVNTELSNVEHHEIDLENLNMVLENRAVNSNDLIHPNVDLSFVELQNEPESFYFDQEQLQLEKEEEMVQYVLQLQRLESPSITVGNGITEEEVDTTVRTLFAIANMVLPSCCNISCDQIMSKHAAYLEQYMLKLQTFGNMSISNEEYLSFYRQTGLDIDNRQQIVIDFLKFLEQCTNKLVKFAKVIPGFSDFDIDDQVTLVKAAMFEHYLIKFGKTGKCLMTSHNITLTPWNKFYHIDEIERILPRQFFDMKISCTEKVLKLHLTMEETLVLRAIVITFPDRGHLKEPEKVELVHNKLIACLHHLFSQRKDDNLPPTFEEIADILAEMRDVAIWDTKFIQEMFEVWPVSSNHQLLKEMVSK